MLLPRSLGREKKEVRDETQGPDGRSSGMQEAVVVACRCVHALFLTLSRLCEGHTNV